MFFLPRSLRCSFRLDRNFTLWRWFNCDCTQTTWCGFTFRSTRSVRANIVEECFNRKLIHSIRLLFVYLGSVQLEPFKASTCFSQLATHRRDGGMCSRELDCPAFWADECIIRVCLFLVTERSAVSVACQSYAEFESIAFIYLFASYLPPARIMTMSEAALGGDERLEAHVWHWNGRQKRQDISHTFAHPSHLLLLVVSPRLIIPSRLPHSSRS